MQLLFILEKKCNLFPYTTRQALPQLAPAHFHFTDAVAEGKAEEIQFNFFTLRTKVTNPINALSTNWPFDLNIHINYENPKMQKFKKKKKFLII